MENQRICKNCKSINSIITDEEEGKIVCKECGKEYEERIIENTYEKITTFDNDGERQIQRVKAPEINLSRKRKRNYKKVEDILKKSGKEISDSTKNETKRLYDDISNNKKLQGNKNLNNIIIGTYYYTLRKNGEAKTTKEIYKDFNGELGKESKNNENNSQKIKKFTEKRIKKGFNKFKKIIDLNEDENELNKREENYIRTFFGMDENKFKLKKLSLKIIENIKEKGFLENKEPRTIAGLSLLLSCKLFKENIDDKNKFYSKFSKKTALVNAYKEIKDNLKDIIPENYADKLNLIQDNNIFP